MRDIPPATTEANAIAARLASWIAVDWAVVIYAAFVAILAMTRARGILQWQSIVIGHGALAGALLLLPARGAPWERPRPGDSRWLAHMRAVARFLRYTYPALLLTFFFEEVSVTVHAMAPGSPYWFEPYLYAADRALFGGVPAVMLSQAGQPVLDEIMHAFYFSYYLGIIGGIVLAWRGGLGRRDTPAAGFHTAITCMMLGFFLSYVWYPFLPARGPWENPALMTGLRPFQGWFFTSAIESIMAHAAVSGGCFPSAHVSGIWALIFGLYGQHRRAAIWFGLVATGLSIACVYTRYHHAVDVLAGLAVAAIAAPIGYRLAREGRDSGPPRDGSDDR